MGYTFRLETLLRFRRSLEELAQQRLGKELKTLRGHQLRLKEERARREQVMREFELRKKQRMKAPLFSLFVDSARSMEEVVNRQITLVRSQEKLVEAARGELLLKVQDRKVMEKARERDFQAYREEQLRLEYKEIDENAVMRSGRAGGLLG